MRNLKEIVEAKTKAKIDIQDNTINYISAKQLKDYLKIADKFLCDDSKEVINWLIVNNANYISELSNDTDENALAGFYNAGVPKDNKLKELYKALGNVVNNDRILEIPVFQTKEQFEAIISKKESPDAIILDLSSEESRNKIAKRYEPLVIKMCAQWNGKSNLSYDELKSAAYEGLTWAMNKYGKKGNKNKVDLDTIVSSMTFGQYAAYMIRTSILEAIKNESQTVRIAVSAQNKERKEKGHNTKNNTVSGDKSVGKDGDEGNKTLFDYIGSIDDTTPSIYAKDIENIQKEIWSKLEEEFDKKILDIFYSFYGLNNHEKMKNKDIAKKYNVSNSNITYYCFRVCQYIRTNKELRELFVEMSEIMQESRDIQDSANVRFENPIRVNVSQNTSVYE